MGKWTPARRKRQSEVASANWAKYWTPERRAEYSERMRRLWRERNPEKAIVRDSILKEAVPGTCVCGSETVSLFVTDYEARTYVWQCRPCAQVKIKRWIGEHKETHQEGG